MRSEELKGLGNSNYGHKSEGKSLAEILVIITEMDGESSRRKLLRELRKLLESACYFIMYFHEMINT